MIEYRKNYPLDPVEVARIFDSSGMTRPTRDIPRIRCMFENANLVISAWSGDRLIAVCRALTDFSFCCYLSDLAVDKEHQRKGIGKEMIKRIQDEIGDEVSLILLSAPGAMSYYPGLGFEKIENGYVVKRKR